MICMDYMQLGNATDSLMSMVLCLYDFVDFIRSFVVYDEKHWYPKGLRALLDG